MPFEVSLDLKSRLEEFTKTTDIIRAVKTPEATKQELIDGIQNELV